MSAYDSHEANIKAIHQMLAGFGPDDHAECERLLTLLCGVYAGALTPVSENEKRGMDRVLAILDRKIGEGGGNADDKHNTFYRGRYSAFTECAIMLRGALSIPAPEPKAGEPVIWPPHGDTCIDCDGSGHYPSKARCRSCGGSGRVLSGDGVATPAGGLGEAEREAVLTVLKPFVTVLEEGYGFGDDDAPLERGFRGHGIPYAIQPTIGDLRAARALFQNLSQEGE